MLVLSRKLNEKVLFPGIDAAIEIVSIKGGVVRLGIEAPRDVTVLRAELQDKAGSSAAASHQVHQADSAATRELVHLLRNKLHSATLGLALLRRQRELGMIQESDDIFDRIEHDVRALRQHVEGLDSKPTSRPPARPSAGSSRRRKALLVEDDSNERELLAGFLRLAGLEVDTAGDGLEALECLHAHGCPDVVLLDMGLPHCDGPTTVREIRRDPACAGLKVFGVSGHALDRFSFEPGAAGVNGWFRKPVNPEELLRHLDRELASTV